MKQCFFFGAALTLALLACAFDARAAEPVAGKSPPASHLRVSAVQMRSTRDLATNVHKIEKFISHCAHDGSRVVVFPECALTGYFDDAFMKAFSAEQLAGAERQVADACRKHARLLQLKLNGIHADFAEQLQRTLAGYRGGQASVTLHGYRNRSAQADLELGEEWRVDAIPALLRAVRALPGVQAARLRIVKQQD